MGAFEKDGNNLYPIQPGDPSKFRDHLPVGIYDADLESTSPVSSRIRLKRDADKFAEPKHVYGAEVRNLRKRIVNHFKKNTAPGLLGALFVGKKGSGKTMLSELIANDMLALEMPVVRLSEHLDNPRFVRDVIKASGPAVFLIDEFEKHFENFAEQERLLSIFSDNDLQGMVILTANEVGKVSQYMRARPQRLYYWVDFDPIDNESMLELINVRVKSPQVRHLLMDDDRYRVDGAMRPVLDNFDVARVTVDLVSDADSYTEFSDALRHVNLTNAHDGGEGSLYVVLRLKEQIILETGRRPPHFVCKDVHFVDNWTVSIAGVVRHFADGGWQKLPVELCVTFTEDGVSVTISNPDIDCLFSDKRGLLVHDIRRYLKVDVRANHEDDEASSVSDQSETESQRPDTTPPRQQIHYASERRHEWPLNNPTVHDGYVERRDDVGGRTIGAVGRRSVR